MPRITEELEAAFEQSRRTDGRPRLTRVLRAGDHGHGARRLGRLRRPAGLGARPRRRLVPQTTQSRHDGPIAPNRLAQRAAPPTPPDEVWTVDMTYFGTREGWLFLAVVLDLHSRKGVGWAFAESLQTALPLAAWRMALPHRRPLRGLLPHLKELGEPWFRDGEVSRPEAAPDFFPISERSRIVIARLMAHQVLLFIKN